MLQRLLRLFKAQRNTRSQSAIQELCDEFDLSHPPTDSQRAEIRQHQRIQQQRDYRRLQAQHSLLSRLKRLLI